MNETGISWHYLFVCLSFGVCNYEWWRRSRQAKNWIAMCSAQETVVPRSKKLKKRDYASNNKKNAHQQFYRWQTLLHDAVVIFSCGREKRIYMNMCVKRISIYLFVFIPCTQLFHFYGAALQLHEVAAWPRQCQSE